MFDGMDDAMCWADWLNGLMQCWKTVQNMCLTCCVLQRKKKFVNMALKLVLQVFECLVWG